MQGGILLILSMFSPFFTCLPESNKKQLFENTIFSCLPESNKKQLFENTTTLNFDFIANHFQAQDMSQIEYLETSMVRTNTFDCLMLEMKVSLK